jgi:membrane fusion protein, multidrug efflux system
MKTFQKSVIFLASVILLASCGSNPEAQLERLKAQKEKINQQIAEIKTQSVQNGTNANPVRLTPVKLEAARNNEFKHFVEVQGNVESEGNINVPAESPGIVQRIYVKRGDAVKRGQLLAELDATIILKSISQVETGLELATTMYDRQKRLWDQKIGSEMQYLQAKANKESFEKQMATLNEQMNLSRITSPISGTVDEIIIREGEMAAAGFPAFRVVELSNLKVKANLSESYINSVKPGDPVSVRLPLLNRELQLKVDAVTQVIDPNSRTFSVEVRIPKSESGIKPNMIAVLVVNNYVNHEAISVPLNSVQKNGHGEFLFVAEQNGNSMVAQRRNVKTGLTYANRVEVLEGVKAGEKVIVSGHQNLANGQLIETVN